LHEIDPMGEAERVRIGERRRSVSFILASLLTGAALAGALTACGVSLPAIDRTDLANDLAARLSHAASVDYAATYQLAEGASATIAQTTKPKQTAYRWTGGSLILTPDSTTKCTGTPPACSTTAPPATASPQEIPELPKHGLVSPQRVGAMLTAAVLDLGTDIQQRDTTVAGQPASCVEVNGERDGAAYGFDVCVVTDGVIGSFSGLVDGVAIEMALTHYSRAVPVDAFITTAPAPAR
jgi:hypothetical protein